MTLWLVVGIIKHQVYERLQWIDLNFPYISIDNNIVFHFCYSLNHIATVKIVVIFS